MKAELCTASGNEKMSEHCSVSQKYSLPTNTIKQLMAWLCWWVRVVKDLNREIFHDKHEKTIIRMQL